MGCSLSPLELGCPLSPLEQGCCLSPVCSRTKKKQDFLPRDVNLSSLSLTKNCLLNYSSSKSATVSSVSINHHVIILDNRIKLHRETKQE